MNRSLALVALLVSLSAFGFAHKQAAPEPAPIPSFTVTPQPSTIPVTPPSPVPAPSPMRIQLGNIEGDEPGEIEMVHAGILIANRMLDNPCYKQWVSAARYTETNGLTSPQVYARQSTQINKVDVELYYENNRVVGFEYDPYDGVVHMNRKFVNTPSMVADNILHEDRGHGLGFHHYGAFSTSVPYGANYAYEGCSEQQQLARGARPHRPKGLRIEVRKRPKGSHLRKIPPRYHGAPKH